MGTSAYFMDKVILVQTAKKSYLWIAWIEVFMAVIILCTMQSCRLISTYRRNTLPPDSLSLKPCRRVPASRRNRLRQPVSSSFGTRLHGYTVSQPRKPKSEDIYLNQIAEWRTWIWYVTVSQGLGSCASIRCSILTKWLYLMKAKLDVT